MIGTPFEIKNDEIHNKRIAKRDRKDMDNNDSSYNSYALNDKGQRLFHGAFTGGFHAGYKDTVGSLEGWKPSEFDRNKKYTVFDIMDEEDLGDHMHGQTIQATKGYDTNGYIQANKQAMGTDVLGAFAPDEFIVAPEDSIGHKLLDQIGWSQRKTDINNFEDYCDQSDDSVDFDKMDDIDVSDFIDENIMSKFVSDGSQNISYDRKQKDDKIKQKIERMKKPKTTKTSVSINYYKSKITYKND